MYWGESGKSWAGKNNLYLNLKDERFYQEERNLQMESGVRESWMMERDGKLEKHYEKLKETALVKLQPRCLGKHHLAVM